MVTFKKPSVDIVTRYSVRYIDNEKDANYVDSGRYDDGEPWERYKQKQFDDFGDAMTQYLVYFFVMTTEKPNKLHHIYDVELFEEILLDGEVVRESHIEPKSTTLYSLRQTLSVKMTEELYSLRKIRDEQEAVIDLHNKFLNCCKLQDMFREFNERLSERH